MHTRVVRFTDVSSDGIAGVVERIEGGEGPPPGVDAAGIQVLYDEAQGTAVVLLFFADEEKMRAAEEVFDSMDTSDTPGTRASVDRCELKVEMDS